MRSSYEILQLHIDAQTEAIQTSYQQLLQACQSEPDEGLRTQRVLELRQAYEQLSNPFRRSNYDATLSQGILNLCVVKRFSELSAAFIGDDSQTLLVFERDGDQTFISLTKPSNASVDRSAIPAYFQWIKPLDNAEFIAINSDGLFFRFKKPNPMMLNLGVEAGISQMSFSSNGNFGVSYSYLDAHAAHV